MRTPIEPTSEQIESSRRHLRGKYGIEPSDGAVLHHARDCAEAEALLEAM